MSNIAEDIVMLGAVGAFFYGLWAWARGRAPVPEGEVSIGMPVVVTPSENPLTSSYAPPSQGSGSQGNGFMLPPDPPGVDTLARTLWGEARGEGTRGMRAVAAVIMNRVASSRFPSTVQGVCRQPWQFSCWNENDPNYRQLLTVTAADRQFADALRIAREAVKGELRDPTEGALHYHTKNILPNWVIKSPNAKVSARIGSHIFYTGIA